MGRIETVSRRAVLRAADNAQEAQAQIVKHVNAQNAAIAGALNQVQALKVALESEQSHTATFAGRVKWMLLGRR